MGKQGPELKEMKTHEPQKLDDIQLEIQNTEAPLTNTRSNNDYDLIISDFIEKKPDVSKKEEVIDETHPRKIINGNKQEFTFSDIFCKTRTGYSCCGYTTPNSIVDRYGVGMTLYFKFVKNLACLFGIFTLLTIPIIYFSIYVANEQNLIDDNYQDVIYGLTIGVFGEYSQRCSHASFKNQTEFALDFECKNKGVLEMDKSLQISFFEEGLNYASCSQISLDQPIGQNSGGTCSKSPNDMVQDYLKITCIDKNKCTINYQDLQTVFENCDSDFLQNDKLHLMAKTQCINQEVEVFNAFGLNLTLDITDISFLVAITDTIIVLIYFINIICMRISDTRTQNYIFERKCQASNFTIMIGNLPKVNEQELKYTLRDHIENYMEHWMKTNHPKHFAKYNTKCKIVDVRIAETSKEIFLRHQLGEYEQRKREQVFLYLKKYDPKLRIQQEKNKINIADIEILVIPSLRKKYQNKAKRDLENLRKLKEHCNKLKLDLDKIDSEVAHIKYAFITFDTMAHKGYALDALKGSAFEDFFGCQSCCVDQRKLFHKKRLIAKESPSPDNIQWFNFYSKASVKLTRRIISILITLAILIGSFIIIVVVRNEKDKVLEKYPSIDCNQEKFDNIQVQQVIDEDKNNDKQGFIQCFCKPRITEIIEYTTNKKGEFKDYDEQVYDICNDWLTDYLFILGLPFASVFCILCVNFAIQIIFRKLSIFEKYSYLTQEYASRIKKIFLAMFVNTGLILLITNIDFDLKEKEGVGYILGGQYADFTPEWFKNVGTIIILTIAVNTISTPAVLLGFQMLRSCKRSCDRGCTSDKSKTKKSTTQQLIDLYTGPEFMIDLRYSQILNTCFIGMMYSSGLPIMYLLVTIHLTLLYWFDKIWVFKICKNPQNYDHQMQDLARAILYILPIIHCIFALYIYGNTQIFFELDNYDSSELQSESKYFIKKFVERAFQDQNIALTFALLAILALILIRVVLWKPFVQTMKKCCKKQMQKGINKNKFRHTDNRKFLNDLDLKQDMLLTEYYLTDSSTDDKNFQRLLEERRQYLLEEIKSREKKEEEKNIDTKKSAMPQMIGIFSYDMRHNDKYRNVFRWEEQLKEKSGRSQKQLIKIQPKQQKQEEAKKK